MVAQRLAAVLRVFRAALAAGLVGFVLLGLAVATATSRYGRCGPSAAAAADAACRTAAHLVAGAEALLLIALLLGAASLSLLWRERRRR